MHDAQARWSVSSAAAATQLSCPLFCEGGEPATSLCRQLTVLLLCLCMVHSRLVGGLIKSITCVTTHLKLAGSLAPAAGSQPVCAWVRGCVRTQLSCKLHKLDAV